MKHLKEPTFIYRALLIVSICFLSCTSSAHAKKADPKELFASGFKFASEDNFKKAQKEFKAVLSASPDNYPSYFNLSLLYFRQNNYKQSLEYSQEASKLNPFDMRINK